MSDQKSLPLSAARAALHARFAITERQAEELIENLMLRGLLRVTVEGMTETPAGAEPWVGNSKAISDWPGGSPGAEVLSEADIEWAANEFSLFYNDGRQNVVRIAFGVSIMRADFDFLWPPARDATPVSPTVSDVEQQNSARNPRGAKQTQRPRVRHEMMEWSAQNPGLLAKLDEIAMAVQFKANRETCRKLDRSCR